MILGFPKWPYFIIKTIASGSKCFRQIGTGRVVNAELNLLLQHGGKKTNKKNTESSQKTWRWSSAGKKTEGHRHGVTRRTHSEGNWFSDNEEEEEEEGAAQDNQHQPDCEADVSRPLLLSKHQLEQGKYKKTNWPKSTRKEHKVSSQLKTTWPNTLMRQFVQRKRLQKLSKYYNSNSISTQRYSVSIRTIEFNR